MATVDVNGKLIDFPDNLTPEQLQQAVASAAQQMGGMEQPDTRSFGRKAWDALAVPEQKSREGLNMLAGMVPNPEPTGNLPMDILRGTPKIAAETMAEAAPSFISRGSILTAGAGKALGMAAPAAKTTLRALGTQGEELSGIAPRTAGALEAAYKDPSILKATKKAASPLYETAKAGLEEGANIFKGMYKPEQILDTAKEYIAKGGTLEPAEALVARKATDALMKSGRYVKDELMAMRETFDGMAKTSQNISEADLLHQRGRFGEVLSKWAPQNKYGGASAFKLGISAGMKGMGVPEPIIAGAFSPRLQGLTAAGAGMAERGIVSPLVNNPQAAMGLSAALQSRRKKK